MLHLYLCFDNEVLSYKNIPHLHTSMAQGITFSFGIKNKIS